ncbi:hypothetical protein [Paenochrobactrum pullorum]|uniref:hypothetical protein n=1 Tax=Paenochrobactrum pullorum TaxID=1324351 RepID=UPI0035BBBDC5
MKESLSGILGEGTANIVLFILLFAAILVGIFIVYAIIKRFSGTTAGSQSFTHNHHEPSSRLAVVDAANVDNQRKLVLVRRDDVEHLILIGGPTDVVVEQNITADSDYARGSRITEAQIARYQNNQTDDFNLEAPARPAAHQRSETLALDYVSSTPASAPSFAAQMPVEALKPIVQKPLVMSEPAPMQTAALHQQTIYRSEHVVSPVPAKTVPTPPVFVKPVPEAPVQNVKAATHQPRTVMPAAPVAKPTTHRAHPAYPLSQVSQGVLTSTSASSASASSSTSAVATAATATVAATAATAANGRLDSVTPQKAASLDDVRPASATPSFAPQQASKPEPGFDPQPSNEANNFASLDDALDQALFNDLNTDFFEPAKSSANKAEDEMSLMLEEELLSSLDMEMDLREMDIEAELSVDIEDEMEKLLGELSINPER